MIDAASLNPFFWRGHWDERPNWYENLTPVMTAAAPAAISRRNGYIAAAMRLFVFVTGTDGRIWVDRFDFVPYHQVESGFVALPPPPAFIQVAPAVAADSDLALHVFIVQNDFRIYEAVGTIP